MKGAELIFVRSPSKGHLIPALEFVKRLVNHDDRIYVTVVSVKLPFDSFADAYIESVKASEPERIKFIDLPQQENSSAVEYLQSALSHFNVLMKTHLPHLKEFITNILSSDSISGSTRFTGFVFDLLFVHLVDIAHRFNVPSYIFLTSNGGYLSLLFHLTTRHARNSSEFKQSDPDQLIPGFINAVPPNVLPSALFDKDNGYPFTLMMAQKFKTVKGIIVNTFEELEPFIINCFSDGGNPPVYPVGPLLDIGCKPHPEVDLAHREKVMKWLNEQPRSSVVFLCFGSFGLFHVSQVKEIAHGLEQSGYRFLWSLRMPQPDASGTVCNNENMLPEGFLERIQVKGMICEWAPQAEILAHKAIGGFVSPCGWNSILESLWFGVPIVTWPMYAEQHLNAFKMLKELGLAVELRLDYRTLDGDVVMAVEIEKAVRQVMDEDSEIRKKVKEIAEVGRKAIANGGSSFLSMRRLIDDMIGHN